MPPPRMMGATWRSWNPMASSRPWIGNGENASVRVYPAAVVCVAAWSRASALANSASSP